MFRCLGSCPYCQMLYLFFLSSICKVEKLQGHSWFPYSCAVLTSSKPLSLSYPWTLLQSLCGFSCRRQGRQCQRAQMELQSTRSCPAWSSWTLVLCRSSCRRRRAAGMPVSASLKGGFQCCGFQPGDTSLCQSIAVPLPLHRNGEKEREQSLSVGLQLQDQAQPSLVLLLPMVFAGEGLVGMVRRALVYASIVEWGSSPVHEEVGFIRKSWAS